MTSIPGMTRQEANDLQRMVKATVRVAKFDLDARAADVIAQFEEAMARQIDEDDELITDLVKDAVRVVTQINTEMLERCTAAGIPKRFAPQIGTWFANRGENADSKRRAELRKVATTHVTAMKKRAQVELDRYENQAVRQLIAGQLSSDAATEWLAALPSPEVLVPALDVREIQHLALTPAAQRDHRP